jgi:hypothetical protein
MSSVPLLDPIIASCVPDRHIWYARAYHFNTDHVGAIFAQLLARYVCVVVYVLTTFELYDVI